MLCADYEDYIRVQEQVGETFLVRLPVYTMSSKNNTTFGCTIDEIM